MLKLPALCQHYGKEDKTYLFPYYTFNTMSYYLLMSAVDTLMCRKQFIGVGRVKPSAGSVILCFLVYVCWKICRPEIYMGTGHFYVTAHAFKQQKIHLYCSQNVNYCLKIS